MQTHIEKEREINACTRTNSFLLPLAGSKIMVGVGNEELGSLVPFTAIMSTFKLKEACASNTSSGRIDRASRAWVMSYLW